MSRIATICAPSFRLLDTTKADAFGTRRDVFDWCGLDSDGTFHLSPCSGGAWFVAPVRRVEPLTDAAREVLLVINAAAAASRLGSADAARRLCDEGLKQYIAATREWYR